MNREEEAVALLREIRDMQRQALDEQRAQRAVLEGHLADSRKQVAESIALQRSAVARARQATLIVAPLIVVLLGLLVYLLVRWRIL
jgi:hypothetical protein